MASLCLNIQLENHQPIYLSKASATSRGAGQRIMQGSIESLFKMLTCMLDSTAAIDTNLVATFNFTGLKLNS